MYTPKLGRLILAVAAETDWLKLSLAESFDRLLLFAFAVGDKRETRAAGHNMLQAPSLSDALGFNF